MASDLTRASTMDRRAGGLEHEETWRIGGTAVREGAPIVVELDPQLILWVRMPCRPAEGPASLHYGLGERHQAFGAGDGADDAPTVSENGEGAVSSAGSVEIGP